MKGSAHKGALAVAPKRQRKVPTIAQNFGPLELLKEDKKLRSCRNPLQNKCNRVHYVKEKNNIRTTAAISFNKDTKMVIIVQPSKTILRMDSVLDLWVSDYRISTHVSSYAGYQHH